ncbi:MAG: tsaD 2 [Firmicutes bacterium]|nr:tsaD 2 [Bacillota bacterium]
MSYILGIDTSCYTTSVALFTEDNHCIADGRKLLAVKPGNRGLAQSEMVYQHTRNLPEVFSKVIKAANSRVEISAVGVTVKPRPIANSFMPAFMVGDSFAKVLALTHGAKYYPISHQENHILAGIWSACGPNTERFLAVHASGGTTEITAVTYTKPNIKVELLGGSIDIAAGQFIDRIGVTLGLSFPAGPSLEALALNGHAAPASLPVAAKDFTISFAGPESHARRLLAKGDNHSAIAAGVELCVSKSLAKLITSAIKATGLKDILLVGGVNANKFIRNFLIDTFNTTGCKLYFPEQQFSSDNALGAAYFASTS